MAIDYLARLDALLEASESDIVAIVPGANMVYFTGLHFHLSERPIIALYSAEGLSFIIPELEVPKLEGRPDLEARRFAWSDQEGYYPAFRDSAVELSMVNRHLGMDGQTMRVFEWLAFKKAGISSKNGVDIGNLLLNQRAFKAPEEIAAMQKAIHISEEALKNVMGWAKPGMTERQIADRLSDEMMKLGGQGNSFGPLVLTGPKSGLPHGNSDDRPWGEDEFLLIDYGAKYNDYPADITRTFCVGEPTDQMRAMYEAVYQANKAAREYAKPGVTAHDLDKVARQIIKEAGFGDYFIHRLGHGLGLDVHELPNIVGGNHQVLEPGMVFTIEPGVYIPNVGGVRIEDNVVVTADGIDVLTSYPREL